MNCEKCQDKGFIEKNAGLIMILCNCKKAREVAEAKGIPTEYLHIDTDGEFVIKPREEAKDDSNSGTGRDNLYIGSADTGQPEKPKKSRAKKKARKVAKKVL